MIFRADLAAAVAEGRKTQTRRLVKPGDRADTSMVKGRPIACVERDGRNHWRVDGRIVGYDWFTMAGVGKNDGSRGGGTATYRQPSYAVQPGRGKPAICRVHIIEIRRQRLQDISKEDALAEGVKVGHMPYSPGWKAFIQSGWIWHGDPDDEARPVGHIPVANLLTGAKAQFACLWDVINPGPKVCYHANPEVWALTLRLVPA